MACRHTIELPPGEIVTIDSGWRDVILRPGESIYDSSGLSKAPVSAETGEGWDVRFRRARAGAAAVAQPGDVRRILAEEIPDRYRARASAGSAAAVRQPSRRAASAAAPATRPARSPRTARARWPSCPDSPPAGPARRGRPRRTERQPPPPRREEQGGAGRRPDQVAHADIELVGLAAGQCAGGDGRRDPALGDEGGQDVAGHRDPGGSAARRTGAPAGPVSRRSLRHRAAIPRPAGTGRWPPASRAAVRRGCRRSCSPSAAAGPRRSRNAARRWSCPAARLRTLWPAAHGARTAPPRRRAPQRDPRQRMRQSERHGLSIPNGRVANRARAVRHL